MNTPNLSDSPRLSLRAVIILGVVVLFILSIWTFLKLIDQGTEVAEVKPSTVVILLDETSSFVNDPGSGDINVRAVDYWQTSLELAALALEGLSPGDRIAIYSIDDDGLDPSNVRLSILEVSDKLGEAEIQLKEIGTRLLDLCVGETSSAKKEWSSRQSPERLARCQEFPGQTAVSQKPTGGITKGTDFEGTLRLVASDLDASSADHGPIRILLFSDMNVEDLPDKGKLAIPAGGKAFSGDCAIIGLNVPEVQLIRDGNGQPVIESDGAGKEWLKRTTIEDFERKESFWPGWMQAIGLDTGPRLVVPRGNAPSFVKSEPFNRWLNPQLE